jgi:diadenylate cyclase
MRQKIRDISYGFSVTTTTTRHGSLAALSQHAPLMVALTLVGLVSAASAGVLLQREWWRMSMVSPVVHLLWLEPLGIVDVVFVGFVLCWLWRLFRRTQATRLIMGMGLLTLVGVASVRLDLELLSQLFQGAASQIVMALIVLFQPELRKVLGQLGRVPHVNRPLRPYNHQVFDQAVAETIPAAERLSARKAGALIVFERNVGLGDFVETGVRLDSRLSAEMLQTIFFPNSPLHDGAVIVRGAKMVAAGCLLPLSDSVHERLGTRHRAAIGLSLLSDALIVVVSEETGAISVVENGTITRNLDSAGLRRRLIRGLPVARPSKGLRQILAFMHA